MNDCFPELDVKLELLKDEPDLDRIRGYYDQVIWQDDYVEWNELCAMREAVKELERQGKKPPHVLHLVCQCPRCSPRC